MYEGWRQVTRNGNDGQIMLIDSDNGCVNVPSMPLNIFECKVCGTRRIWGNWDVDKKEEKVPGDRPPNHSPFLTCAECDKTTPHLYITDCLDFSDAGKNFVRQAQLTYWVSADAYREMMGQVI